jgi:hypothetical protein
MNIQASTVFANCGEWLCPTCVDYLEAAGFGEEDESGEEDERALMERVLQAISRGTSHRGT